MIPEGPSINREHPGAHEAARCLQPSIEVHINELVLHGFAPKDRHRIGAAVQSELARLLAERGMPAWLAEGGEVDRLDGGKFEVTPATGAESIGAQVAEALHRGLER
jgi:hypothetical protein